MFLERTIIMKKLTYLASAIAASFGANAYADVSVSGSGSVGYVNGTDGDGNLVNGSSVDFGLSTTTANGITVSTGLSITVSVTSENGASAGGGQALTFATGGATIVVGDITIADQPGSVGGVAGGTTVENGGHDSDVSSGFDDDDGPGVSLSTAVGGATVSVGYIFDTGSANNSQVNITDATNGASAFGISMPMGAYTISAGVADHDSGESAAGASVAASIGGGTLTIGYSSQTQVADATGGETASFTTTFEVQSAATLTDAAVVSAGTDTTSVAVLKNTTSGDDLTTAGDTEVLGATYSMALDADTTVSVGYQSKKDADSESTTQFDLAISRSLGGGASVYLDMRTLSGDTDGANGDGTAFGFGTSVAF